MKFFPRRNCDSHAFFQTYRTQICLPRPCQDNNFNGTFGWVQTERAAAVVAARPNVTTLKRVPLDQFANCIGECGTFERDFESINLSRRVETTEMCVEPKDGRTIVSRITAHPFKDATAIVQCVRRDVRGCVCPGNEGAIHPYPFRLIESH